MRAHDPCERIVNTFIIGRFTPFPKTDDSGNTGKSCEDQNPPSIDLGLDFR
jgi:hypothetical protein